MKLSVKIPKKDLEEYRALLNEMVTRRGPRMADYERVNAREFFEQMTERLGAHSDKAKDYRIKWTFQHHYLQTVEATSKFAANHADIFYSSLAMRVHHLAQGEFHEKVKLNFKPTP